MLADDPIGWLAVAGLCAWTLVTWKGGVLLFREVGQLVGGNRPLEAVVLVLGVSANMVNVIYELARRAWHLPNYALGIPTPVRLAGFALFVVGFVWATWSRRSLGRAWSVAVRRPEGSLHREGPYRFMRHPIYAGAAGLYVGLLLLQNNVNGAFFFGAQITGFLVKAAREDRFLSLKVPQEYGAYKSNVRWRLFPGVW